MPGQGTFRSKLMHEQSMPHCAQYRGMVFVCAKVLVGSWISGEIIEFFAAIIAYQVAILRGAQGLPAAHFSQRAFFARSG